MLRYLLTVSAFSVVASPAFAQPRPVAPLPNYQVPQLAPGVHPASPWGPGMPMTAPRRSSFPTVVPQVAPWDAWNSWGNWGYQNYVPFNHFGFSWGFGGFVPYAVPVPFEGPAVAPPAPPERTIVLANEFPATLTLQFPVAAEVWLNGKPVGGPASEERVLTSPVLKPGENFTFDIKARWTTGGKTYEATRSVTLNPGDKSRLFIVSGNETNK